MIAFGLFGFVMIAIIVASVRSWFSETRRVAQARAAAGGAAGLWNRNTILLTVLCIIHGLSMYGFLGGYASFLQENLHYTPTRAGVVVGFFAIGALASIAGGWLGDRFSPRLVLCAAFVCIAVLGYLFFQQTPSVLTREILTCIYGVVGSAVLYVSLAAYHVRSLQSGLSSKGSGMFVTSLYGGAAFGGYLIRALASQGGWLFAGGIQMSLLCAIGAVLALALRPGEMSRPKSKSGIPSPDSTLVMQAAQSPPIKNPYLGCCSLRAAPDRRRYLRREFSPWSRGEPDWNALIAAACEHALTSLVCKNLQDCAPAALPAEWRERFSRSYFESPAAIWRLRPNFSAFWRRSKVSGVSATPYKGPVLAAQAYGDIALARIFRPGHHRSPAPDRRRA